MSWRLGSEGRKMQLNTILDQIDVGAMTLPESQPGYVWNRE